MTGAVKAFTTNISLRKLYFSFPNWGDDANSNMDIIDAAFGAIGLSSIQGIWDNSVTYGVGDKLIDDDLGSVWVCLVGHTSAASGTFLADRTLHPTYWDPFGTTGVDLLPVTNDVSNIGSASQRFSTLFLNTGINFRNSDMVLTATSNLLTLTGGDFTLSGAFTTNSITAGSGAYTSMTVGALSVTSITGGSGAFTTLSASGALTASGGGSLTGTWSNLGTVTTIDINGGTIDNTVIGGGTPAAAAFTSVTAGTGTFTTSAIGTGSATSFSTGTLTASGAFTSLGIDDNATGARLLVEDARTLFGPSSTTDYYLGRFNGSAILTIGAAITVDVANSSQLRLWGPGHANVGDFLLGYGAAEGIAYDRSLGALTLGAGGSGVIYMQDGVGIQQNSTVTPGFGNSTAGWYASTGGEYICSGSGNGALNVGRTSGNGTLIGLNVAGVSVATITTSGGVVTYGTFFGTHWSQLADNSRSDILQGTIVESIDQMCVWQAVQWTDLHGVVHNSEEMAEGKQLGDIVYVPPPPPSKRAFTGVVVAIENYQLPCFKISDTPGSKAVYGVFSSWDGESNDAFIGSLGAYVIRIDADQTVQIGDYIESAGNGCGRVQADDILRARTVAKITSTTVTETYPDGSYLVPCTLHCG